jgi:serine/threonine-protein kinase ATR
MESYSRCYPGLVRLHILRELEQGMEMSCAAASRLGSETSNSHSFVADYIGDDGFRWSQRISVISSSTKQRDEVLSIRRAIFGLLRDHTSVANLWLQSSESLRLAGRFDSALNSLRKAESFGLDAEVALLEHSRILKGNGNVRKALLLLEPDETLMNELKIRATQTPKHPMDLSAIGLEPQQLATRLHLSTQWMVEHKLAYGREILDRLKVIVYLNKDWETALFYFAKYNDELFESKLKELLKRGTSPSDDDKAMYQFAVTALEYYGKAIKAGNEFLMQSMPQFLSVFFSFMGLVGSPSQPPQVGSRGGGPVSSMLALAQRTMGSRTARYAQDIPACKWYTCTPQIASRIGHQNAEAIKTVKLLLRNILIDFPEQGIWHVCSLLHSLNSERRAAGKVLIREAAVELERLKRHASSTMLQESIVMFSSLVDLAQAQTKDRRIRWSIGADLELRNFLVPSQAALSIAFPENSENPASWTYFPFAQTRIASFDNIVEVMMTKAKPKKIALTTTTGATVRFLLKQVCGLWFSMYFAL